MDEMEVAIETAGSDKVFLSVKNAVQRLIDAAVV
jgi:hypothetical protein